MEQMENINGTSNQMRGEKGLDIHRNHSYEGAKGELEK